MTSSSAFMRPGVYTKENLTPLVGSGALYGEAAACFVAPYNIGPAAPKWITSWQQYVQFFGDFSVANGSLLPYAVYSYFANNQGSRGCFVLRVPNTDATQAAVQIHDISNDSNLVATVVANAPGVWGSNIYVELVTAGTAGHVNVNIYYGGTAQRNLAEQFLNMSANPSDPRYIVSIINSPVSGSNFVQWNENLPDGYTAGVTDYTLNPGSPAAMSGSMSLETGEYVGTASTDGSVAPVLGTVVPTTLDNYLTQQVLNINLPGINDPATMNTLTAWCENRDDCMLFIDGPVPNIPETSAQVVANYLAMLSGGSSIDATTYGCIHAPWLLINDPASSNAGATKYIPPSGTVLGLYAAADLAVGPQQAGAGTSYGQISTVDLECRFNPTDLDTLNVNMINAIKMVPGVGFCNFGVRTLQPGYPSQYVPIRRTLMKLEHDCVELTQFALFEPNTVQTWNNVKTVLNTYLTQMTQQNMFGSTDPSAAFLVICDETNNPPASAQAGLMNVSLAVMLGSPAEFILITISQLQSGVTTASS